MKTRYYTGEDASNLKGNFLRSCCGRTTRMHGNYQDRIPPCNICKAATYYTEVIKEATK